MPTANLQDTLREEFGKRYINDIELPASFATSLAPTRVLRPYQEECFRYFITYMQENLLCHTYFSIWRQVREKR